MYPMNTSLPSANSATPDLPQQPSRRYLPVLALVAATTVLASCSSSDDDDGVDSSDDLNTSDPAGENGDIDSSGTSGPAPGSNPEDLFLLEGVDGTWVQGCQPTPAEQVPHATSRLDITVDTAQLTLSAFSDAGCTTSLGVTVTDFSVVYSPDTTTTALGEANHVDLTVESINLNGVTLSAGVNAIRYDIILMTNNSLYLGDLVNSGDGSTPEARPTELNQLQFFTQGDAG